MLKEEDSSSGTLCLKGSSTTRGGVWMCEACEQAPVAFLCKADAASLCAACDAVIHSANPLARRHHRVPLMPYGNQETDHPRSIIGFLSQDQDDNEAASWLLFDENDVAKNGKNENQYGNGNTNGFLFNSCQDTRFSDDLQFDDQFMSKATYNGDDVKQRCDIVPRRSYDADSVVPVQHQKFELGMEYETSNAGYPASLSHSVSMSSMDVGVVPESMVTDVSISNTRTPKGTINLFSSPSIQIPTQLTPIDREARVLRYREKKKTRKFEKTIRYASRKAYAEKRPRIKGRFAKRTNVDVEVEQMFSTTLMTDGGYCIVPSF